MRQTGRAGDIILNRRPGFLFFLPNGKECPEGEARKVGKDENNLMEDTIFIMSDIHGSMTWLQKALARYEAERAGEILLLGDELYHGPRNPLPDGYAPKDVAARLNELADRILAVRGNCDSEVDEMVLDFPILSTYSQVLAGGRRLFLTHGHVYGPAHLPRLRAGDAFFYGHTHVPVARQENGIAIVNPGSVSLPKEDSPHSYAVLRGNHLEIKDMAGHTFRQIEL